MSRDSFRIAKLDNNSNETKKMPKIKEDIFSSHYFKINAFFIFIFELFIRIIRYLLILSAK